MPALARRPARSGDNQSATRDNLRESLLSWYDGNGRELPWRRRDGAADPYRVWLSEIMLQQTTAAAVAPYFGAFLASWPDVQALARAPREVVLEAWAGLGYYSRARNLHRAAQMLAAEGFPETEEGWRAVPGVGPYTASAIVAIAYGQPANVVDGNVERVMARLHAVEALLPGAKAELRARAGELVAPERPGDWAQALMDLGALVCRPRAPKCGACPWSGACAALARGAPEAYPRRAAKAERPRRYGAAFRIERAGVIWLVRRPERGLLAGMAALPTTEWRERPWPRAEALKHAPADGVWSKVGAVQHAFTHFALTLDVYESDAAPRGEGWWGDVGGLPTVFRKAAAVRK